MDSSLHYFQTLLTTLFFWENVEQFKAADDPMIHNLSFAQLLIGA